MRCYPYIIRGASFMGVGSVVYFRTFRGMSTFTQSTLHRLKYAR